MTAARKLVKYYVRPILNNIKNKDSLNLGSSKLYFDRIELIKRKLTSFEKMISKSSNELFEF